jgi:hypothetical protein
MAEIESNDRCLKIPVDHHKQLTSDPVGSPRGYLSQNEEEQQEET